MNESILEAFGRGLGKLASYSRIRNFCKQVENGEEPDKEFLQDLAKAFRKLLEIENREKGLRAFAAAMGLTGKKGRRKTGQSQDRQFRAAVESYILEFQGMGPTEAVEKAADEFNSKNPNPKYIWDARRKQGESAKSVARYILKVEREFKNLTRGYEQALAFAESISKKKN